MLLLAQSALAQVQEPEEILPANDAFRDAFYEAITQKSIENYDKALQWLQTCKKLQPQNTAVDFEMGKNYLAQKNYSLAYESFERVTKADPNHKWALVGMYDVCYESRNFERAIPIVQKLATFSGQYNEELVSLYMTTQQFDKALTLINQLNKSVGHTDQRDHYKSSIMQDPKYHGSERALLLEQITANPSDESPYISLMFMYWEANQDDKAYEIAQRLEKAVPGSEWAHISLFKYHLSKNDAPKAVKSMDAVLSSKKIDDKIRHRVFNEFLLFAREKPELSADLQRAIGYFDNDPNISVAKEVGKFFHAKSQFDKAVVYYEKHLSNHSGDIETQMLLLESYSGAGQFEALAKRADVLLESYPLQPDFYFYSGLAKNQLKQHKKAIESLEMGADYVIDNDALLAQFNIQLGEAWHALGDTTKKERYFSAAEKLIQKTKK